MELVQVDPESYDSVIDETLKTILNEDEQSELHQGIMLQLDNGSHLYEIKENDKQLGFLLATPLYDTFEEEDPDDIDLISIEDIWIKSGNESKELAENLSSEIKKLGKSLGVNQVELIISQHLSWISESLNENGYIASEVKLEKLLPRSNNLGDVLELIQDCTPIDRIVQVLMEKNEEYRAEIVERVEELQDLLDENWIPVMVVVTFEPESQEIEDIIDESDQLIKWNDYSVVYYI